MGKMQRAKGRRAESEFKRLLQDRDWTIDADLSAGISSADLLATDPAGVTYLVEVKNHKASQWAYFKAQAVRQAKDTKRPWLLAVKIDGYSSYVVIKRGDNKPAVWHAKEVDGDTQGIAIEKG